MKAGRELDALIAEKVMGLEPVNALKEWWWTDAQHKQEIRLPHHSTHIYDAFEVVEKIKNNDTENFELEWFAGQWRASFYGLRWTRAETAPLAICLAALAALGGKEGT